jgi:hypothetical protein
MRYTCRLISLISTTLLCFGSRFALAVPAPSSATAPIVPLTNAVNLRSSFEEFKLPVKRQGARNTCSVMTMVGAMEFAVSKKLNQGIPLSAEYLNWACNQVIHNSTQDRGQFFHDLLKGYETFGICTETEMPYTAKFTPDYEPSIAATNHAGVIRAYGLRAHWLKPFAPKPGVSDDVLEQVKATLRQGWPVCAGSFHSVLVIGYQDTDSAPGGGQFYCRDSGQGRENTMSYQEAKGRLCDLLWFDTAATASPDKADPR